MECHVGNVNVYCGSTNAAKRRRRSVVREVYVKVDIVAQQQSGSVSQTVSQLEQILNNNAKPLMDQQAKSLDWRSLRSSTDLEYQRYTLSDAEAYCSESGAVVGKCDSLESGCDGLTKPHTLCQCNKDSGQIEKCSKFSWSVKIPFHSALKGTLLSLSSSSSSSSILSLLLLLLLLLFSLLKWQTEVT